VRVERAFELVIVNLLDGIEVSGLRQGDRLPPEADLAKELSVSRPTLRQALRILERSGLLGTKRGAGGGIFLKSELIPVDVLETTILNEERLVVDVLVARRVLETAITELATEVATSGDYTELSRALRLHERHLGDVVLALRADNTYHRLIARACHNDELRKSMRSITRKMAEIKAAYSSELEVRTDSLEVHRRQLAAMQARDYGELRRVLDRHFRIVEEDFARAMGKSWDELFSSDNARRHPSESAE
jgi:GntR family transcriptional repressor for pyruvate dehydrogenase complex